MSLAVTLTDNLARLDPLTLAHAPALVAAATEPGAAYRYTAVPAHADAAVPTSPPPSPARPEEK